MPKTLPKDREESFRVRFLGNAEIPILVRLFGLYLAVPVTALLGGGAAVAFVVISREKNRPSEFRLAVAGCLLAIAAAVISYWIGRALQTGRRWAVWATMVLCLLASVTATLAFTDRTPKSNQAGSIAFFALALPALVAFLVAIRHREVFQPLEEKAGQKVKNIFKWGIPGVLFILVIGYLGLTLVAERYERSVNDRWVAFGLNPAEMPTRFPRAKANRTARVLTNMVATPDAYRRSVGPDSYHHLLEPTAPYARAFGFMKSYVPPFKDGWQPLVDTLKKPGDDVGEMPADITTYLDANRANFDLMYQEIRNEPPQWDLDVSRGITAPVPNFLDARSIVNLICLDATNLLRQGKKAEALAALECAWIVSRSFSARPEIISQLAAAACLKTIALTLRKMDGVPSEWHARLSDPDGMKRFQVGLASEAYGLTEGAKKFGIAGFDIDDPGNHVSLWRRSLCRLTRPLARYAAAEISETYLLALQRVAKLDGCGVDPNPFLDLQTPSSSSSRISNWNPFVLGGMLNLNAYWRNDVKNRFILEMTDRILKVKEAGKGGTLPQTVAGMESSICPDSRWEYKPEPNAFTLTFSKKSRLFDRDNEAEKEGLFTIQWPWPSRQSSVASRQ